MTLEHIYFRVLLLLPLFFICLQAQAEKSDFGEDFDRWSEGQYGTPVRPSRRDFDRPFGWTNKHTEVEEYINTKAGGSVAQKQRLWKQAVDSGKVDSIHSQTERELNGPCASYTYTDDDDDEDDDGALGPDGFWD